MPKETLKPQKFYDDNYALIEAHNDELRKLTSNDSGKIKEINAAIRDAENRLIAAHRAEMEDALQRKDRNRYIDHSMAVKSLTNNWRDLKEGAWNGVCSAARGVAHGAEAVGRGVNKYMAKPLGRKWASLSTVTKGVGLTIAATAVGVGICLAIPAIAFAAPYVALGVVGVAASLAAGYAIAWGLHKLWQGLCAVGNIVIQACKTIASGVKKLWSGVCAVCNFIKSAFLKIQEMGRNMEYALAAQGAYWDKAIDAHFKRQDQLGPRDVERIMKSSSIPPDIKELEEDELEEDELEEDELEEDELEEDELEEDELEEDELEEDELEEDELEEDELEAEDITEEELAQSWESIDANIEKLDLIENLKFSHELSPKMAIELSKTSNQLEVYTTDQIQKLAALDTQRLESAENGGKTYNSVFNNEQSINAALSELAQQQNSTSQLAGNDASHLHAAPDAPTTEILPRSVNELDSKLSKLQSKCDALAAKIDSEANIGADPVDVTNLNYLKEQIEELQKEVVDKPSENLNATTRDNGDGLNSKLTVKEVAPKADAPQFDLLKDAKETMSSFKQAMQGVHKKEKETLSKDSNPELESDAPSAKL